jgi:hypothetical protein
MVEWLKALGSIKDPLLILLGVVVLAVLWLSFRLVQTVISATTGQVVVAINSLTEELKLLSKDQTRLTVCVDDMKRHQEICINRPRPSAHGDKE